MLSPHWLHNVVRKVLPGVGRGRRKPRPPEHRAVRPRVEQLECRLVPTISFANKVTFSTGNHFPFGVATGDFNGDGKPDIVVAGESNTISVLLNTTPTGASTPSFAAGQVIGIGGSARGVTVADINGDGKPDIITANYGGSISVLMNTTPTGSSNLTFAPAVNIATPQGTYGVTVGDLNGDGKPDLAVASDYGSSVSILLNTTPTGATTPTFAPRVDYRLAPFPTSWRTREVALGDFTGDGKLDFAAIRSMAGAGVVSVFKNHTATGSLTPNFGDRQDLTVAQGPLAVAVGDLNGDGKPDLVTSNSSGKISVLLNTTPTGAATPTFAAEQDLVDQALGGPVGGLVLRSFSGSGKLDIAASNFAPNPGQAEVFQNNTPQGSSTISFGAAQHFVGDTGVTDIASADFNGDGKPDLVMPSFVFDGAVDVLLNTSQTTNTPPVLDPISDHRIPTSQQTLTVTLSGHDSDGDPLTYSATGQSEAYVLYQQNGSLTYNSGLDNWGGRNEKWLQDGGGQWYFILSDGSLYQWDGSSQATGTLLGRVGASYYNDPTQLLNPPANQPHATLSVAGNTLTISRDTSWISSMVITATVSDGLSTDSKSFFVNVSDTDTGPVLTAIPNQTIASSQQVVTVGLSASDPDGDPITFTVTAQSEAYVLYQQYGSLTYNSGLDNWGGRNEKWLQDGGGQWYFILSDGSLYQWDGSSQATGTLLGNVGKSYYTDPTQLLNPPANQPHATFSISGTTLTITRDTSWISGMVITVTASDGQLTDSKTFNLTVTP